MLGKYGRNIGVPPTEPQRSIQVEATDSVGISGSADTTEMGRCHGLIAAGPAPDIGLDPKRRAGMGLSTAAEFELLTGRDQTNARAQDARPDGSRLRDELGLPKIKPLSGFCIDWQIRKMTTLRFPLDQCKLYDHARGDCRSSRGYKGGAEPGAVCR